MWVKRGVYRYSSSIEVGIACGKYDRVCILVVIGLGDFVIIRSKLG